LHDSDDSHDNFQSNDTDDASHPLFEEVLHKIMERIVNAPADGEVPEQALG
jgi:hypothetical protein